MSNELLQTARERVSGKRLLILAGEPREEKRISLEATLGTEIDWPTLSKSQSPKKLYGDVERADVVLFCPRWMSHGHNELREHAAEVGVPVVWMNRGLGEGRVIQELVSQLTTPEKEQKMPTQTGSTLPARSSSPRNLKEDQQLFEVYKRLSPRKNSKVVDEILRQFVLRGIDPRTDPVIPLSVQEEIGNKAYCGPSNIRMVKKEIRDEYLKQMSQLETQAQEQEGEPLAAEITQTTVTEAPPSAGEMRLTSPTPAPVDDVSTNDLLRLAEEELKAAEEKAAEATKQAEESLQLLKNQESLIQQLTEERSAAVVQSQGLSVQVTNLEAQSNALLEQLQAAREAGALEASERMRLEEELRQLREERRTESASGTGNTPTILPEDFLRALELTREYMRNPDWSEIPHDRRVAVLWQVGQLMSMAPKG